VLLVHDSERLPERESRLAGKPAVRIACMAGYAVHQEPRSDKDRMYGPDGGLFPSGGDDILDGIGFGLLCKNLLYGGDELSRREYME
jgi:hypothetical protein